MNGKLIRVAIVVVGVAMVAAAAALAKPEEFRVGNLFLRDEGGIRPNSLPRHEQLPITAFLKDRIGTLDGTHPPAFESLAADFDRTITLDAKGLPVCRLGQLQSRSSVDARRACPGAIVGSGEAEVEVAFAEQEPFSATGPIVAFNGGVQGGKTLLFVHAYVDVPAPTAVVATVELTPIDRGHFGLHAVAKIPRIAGGSGSATRFRMTIGRRFTYKGRQRSYLSASCPTGTYFAEGKVRFSDNTVLKVAHALPCRPVD